MQVGKQLLLDVEQHLQVEWRQVKWKQHKKKKRSVVVLAELILVTWWSLSFSSQMIFFTSLLLSFFTVCTSADVDRCCSEKHKHKEGSMSKCQADTQPYHRSFRRNENCYIPGPGWECPDGSWNLQTRRKAEECSGCLISWKEIALSGIMNFQCVQIHINITRFIDVIINVPFKGQSLCKFLKYPIYKREILANTVGNILHLWKSFSQALNYPFLVWTHCIICCHLLQFTILFFIVVVCRWKSNLLMTYLRAFLRLAE